MLTAQSEHLTAPPGVCVNNIGPSLGDVGPAVNYGHFTAFQTWVCTFGMLLGRLELLSLLVLLAPQFWRR